jgi:hypothetical protein
LTACFLDDFSDGDVVKRRSQTPIFDSFSVEVPESATWPPEAMALFEIFTIDIAQSKRMKSDEFSSLLWSRQSFHLRLSPFSL